MPRQTLGIIGLCGAGKSRLLCCLPSPSSTCVKSACCDAMLDSPQCQEAIEYLSTGDN